MSVFHILTLGCKVNQYESRALTEAWEALGHARSARPEEADVIVINSCAVTARAVADLRAVLRRLRKAAPHAPLIVTGCAPAAAGELAGGPGGVRGAVSGVILMPDKAALLSGFPPLPGGVPALAGAKGPGTGAASAPGGPVFPPFAVTGYERSRAVLKIQDGCSHGCAYCIVPRARGPARSRAFADSLAEARRLLEAGFPEIVISGVNLRQYRDEAGGFTPFLGRLDAALAPEYAGRARLRLSSLEPGQLDGALLETLAGCRLVAPHIHLSLQSGSAPVLARMGRGHYDPAGLPEFFRSLAGLWPRFALGADLLTGFPGETDAEYEESLALIKALPLSYAHVFPYSVRPGTRAAAMPGQVPQAVKKERAARLRAHAARRREAFLRSLLDEARLQVVFEDGRHGICEFYVDCRLEAGSAPARALTPVRPVALSGKGLAVGLLDGEESP